MQAAAGPKPILNVLPFHQKKFAVITTGSEDVYKRQAQHRLLTRTCKEEQQWLKPMAGQARSCAST